MENLFAIKLKELRERNKLSLQELADQVGVAKQSIHKFENGVVSPSSETLLKIADALNVSYSFFYENSASYNLSLQNIKFREKHKINNVQLENEIKEDVCRYLSKFMELCTIMDENLVFENPLEGLEIVTDKDIEKAAKLIRKKWKMGNAPIADVVETLETKGVFVVEVNRLEDFSGLSGMVNEEIPIIVLNEYFNSIERKRFTALHELGHIVLEFPEDISETKLERYCDMFAGAVLLVDDVLYSEFGKKRTIITLAELKRIKELYGISIQAIIMRASTSDFIDNDTSRVWWQSYNEWNSSDGVVNEFGNYRSCEKAQRFNTTLVRGVAEKRLSISKAAELAGKKIGVMRKELDELNFNVRA
jgi:Zn-dependent peptidase ImmA (M78 family)/transcriptional regulator with XRE-family HTH domain